MWVLIDNYDSFTHILHHYLLQAGGKCAVYRNDAISLDELIRMEPSRLIISPGPETPLQAGISMAAINHFYDKIPVLGICLGHQAIGMHFGARLVHAPAPLHGKVRMIAHDGRSVFRGLPSPMPVMRYHSLAITDTEGTGLEVLATAADGTVMAVRHRALPCLGLQFHPESVGTDDGLTLIRNWAAQP